MHTANNTIYLPYIYKFVVLFLSLEHSIHTNDNDEDDNDNDNDGETESEHFQHINCI